MEKEGKYSMNVIYKLGGLGLIKRTFLTDQDRDEGEIVDIGRLRKEQRKTRTMLGDYESLMKHIEFVSRDIKQVKVDKTIIKLLKTKPRTTKRVIKATWSDWHLGSNLDGEAENERSYGIVEESRAVASLVRKISQFNPEYRQETELVIEVLGDMMQGDLHDGGIAAPLHEQTNRTHYVLLKAISVLATQFKKITVWCAVGNHGRDSAVHRKRATSQKWNSYEMSIYGMLRQSLKPLTNVHMKLDKKAYFEYKLFGHWYYGTHGDTNLSIGGVGKTLNTGKIEGQTSRINAQQQQGKRYDVFTVGHFHQSVALRLPTGPILLVNGTITPPDGFAGTMGIVTPYQDQWLVEVTKDYAVGQMRLLDVTDSANDKSLDQIIAPWTGL
jgi:hypothetical protein